MRDMRQLGLLENEPIRVRDVEVRPRDVFIHCVSPHLTRPDDPDMVVLRVEATGTTDGTTVTHRWNMLDRKDEKTGITAMERCTGYTLSITGLLMGRDVIASPGVMSPDDAIPTQILLEELGKRGVVVEHEVVTG